MIKFLGGFLVFLLFMFALESALKRITSRIDAVIDLLKRRTQ